MAPQAPQPQAIAPQPQAIAPQPQAIAPQPQPSRPAATPSGPARTQAEVAPKPVADSTVSPVGAATPIRSVDWKNRTYMIGGRKSPLRNGTYLVDKGMDDYFKASLLDILYGDITGDQQEEAVLVTHESWGGTGSDYGALVFSWRGGAPVQIATIAAGDRGDGAVARIEFGPSELRVTRLHSRDEDGLCCPSQVQIERHVWADGKLSLDPSATRLTAYTPGMSPYHGS